MSMLVVNFNGKALLNKDRPYQRKSETIIATIAYESIKTLKTIEE